MQQHIPHRPLDEQKLIPPELVQKMCDYLQEDGMVFFRNLLRDHGTVNACWMEGGIPHPVHFREGMQVRNFMRQSGLCMDWTDYDYDNMWGPVVIAAITEGQ